MRRSETTHTHTQQDTTGRAPQCCPSATALSPPGPPPAPAHAPRSRHCPPAAAHSRLLAAPWSGRGIEGGQPWKGRRRTRKGSGAGGALFRLLSAVLQGGRGALAAAHAPRAVAAALAGKRKQPEVSDSVAARLSCAAAAGDVPCCGGSSAAAASPLLRLLLRRRPMARSVAAEGGRGGGKGGEMAEQGKREDEGDERGGRPWVPSEALGQLDVARPHFFSTVMNPFQRVRAGAYAPFEEKASASDGTLSQQWSSIAITM